MPLQSGWAIAEGRVKNTSDRPLKNVMASVTFVTRSDEFITNGDALIDYNPILPGQTSPFKVMATANPAMQSAQIDFRHFSGQTIRWRKQ